MIQPQTAAAGGRQVLGTNPAMRRAWLAHNTGRELAAVAETAFTADDVRPNIENLVGATHVPLGIAGPILVNGEDASGWYHVPFATTEGTLVSTYQYGMRAISKAGGATTRVLGDGLDITPCFVVEDLDAALRLGAWLEEHVQELREAAGEVTSHGRLEEIRPHVFGRRVLAQCCFATGDAMGMNMVNLAADRICEYVAERVPVRHRFLRCNYSSDKKPSALNLFRSYGKEVAVDVRLPATVVETDLGVAPEDLLEFAAAGRIGTTQAGTLGMNAHFANGLAAVYLACGQDVAQIVNASIGFIDIEALDDDIYVAARLPNLVVGTVGGGTGLPTQRECLALMDCAGDGRARRFAEIVAATLVAGDLAISAALANGRFIEAHRSKRASARRGGAPA